MTAPVRPPVKKKAPPVLLERAGHPAVGVRARSPWWRCWSSRGRRRRSSSRARSSRTTCRSAPRRPARPARPARRRPARRPPVAATPTGREPPGRAVEERAGAGAGALPDAGRADRQRGGHRPVRQRDAGPRSPSSGASPDLHRQRRRRTGAALRGGDRRRPWLSRPDHHHGAARERAVQQLRRLHAGRHALQRHPGRLRRRALQLRDGPVPPGHPGRRGDTRGFRFSLSVQDDPAAAGRSATFGFSWRTEAP